ncbi:MAG: hypothetical protein HZR80_02180 [Candidatus Heimdallarchaeota archaeon]
MALRLFYEMSDELFEIIGSIIKKHKECSMIDIQEEIHKLWNEGKLPPELSEVLLWKRSQPYSHFIESIISTYVIRGRIRQTEFGNYVLSQYGTELLTKN